VDLSVETIKEDITPQKLHRDGSKRIEKGTPVRSGNGSRVRNLNENLTDLQGLLINILSENPKGMNLKVFFKFIIYFYLSLCELFVLSA
jgi:hypothetical protein